MNNENNLASEPSEVIEEELTARKPGPVVVKRKREGIALCKVFDPVKPPKWKSVVLEPKFDGYRCIARIKDGHVELFTSTGLPHRNVDHIIDQLEAAARENPNFCDNIVLDGEVMHESLPFDVAGGILRKFDKDSRALGFIYHVWDCVSVDDFDSKTNSRELIYRKADLEMAIDRIKIVWNSCTPYPPATYVQLVEYHTGALADVDQLARKFVLEDGYEGIVIKDADAPYNFGGKKGNCWLKWKPAYDGDAVKDMKEGDFRITGIKPGRGKHAGRVGAIYITGYLLEDGNISPDCPNPNGENKTVTGRAGTGLDDAQREQFQKWSDEGTLIGRCIEIHYQELSSEGSVRFPVFYRLREDKDQ